MGEEDTLDVVVAGEVDISGHLMDINVIEVIEEANVLKGQSSFCR